MKRVIACAITLGLAFALFSFVPGQTVSAATYTGSPAVHKSASGSGSGVTYEVILDQYYPEQNADSGLAAGEVYTMVYYRITNSNDQAAYVRNTGFTIQWVTTPYIVRYETVTDDLYLGYQNTSGAWYIYGDSPYSYSSGIVVAPHSSLYCVGYIVTSASVNGNTISSQAISSVSVASHTITLGDYPYGNGTQQLDEIADLLSNIESYLSLTGSLPSIQEVWYARRNRTFADMGVTYPSSGFSGSVRIFKSGSFALSETAIGEISGGAYRNNCYVIPFQISLWITNNTGHAVKSSEAVLTFTDLFDRTVSPASLLIYGYDSDLIGMPSFQSLTASNYIDLLIPLKYQYDGFAYIPEGTYRECFTVLAIFDSENPTYSYNNNYGFSCTFTTSELDISYNPIFPLDHMSSILDQIYAAMSSGSYSGTVQDSQDLQATEEVIHQQEAQWYADNQTAIEATGLGNYQFNNGFISSFRAAREQIALLWNALGDWTYVYYLVFLLGLATYILRHEPTMKAKQARAAAAQAQKERTEYFRSHKK